MQATDYWPNATENNYTMKINRELYNIHELHEAVA